MSCGHRAQVTLVGRAWHLQSPPRCAACAELEQLGGRGRLGAEPTQEGRPHTHCARGRVPGHDEATPRRWATGGLLSLYRTPAPATLHPALHPPGLGPVLASDCPWPKYDPSYEDPGTISATQLSQSHLLTPYLEVLSGTWVLLSAGGGFWLCHSATAVCSVFFLFIPYLGLLKSSRLWF